MDYPNNKNRKNDVASHRKSMCPLPTVAAYEIRTELGKILRDRDAFTMGWDT
jgi:hypothetical protein